MHRRIINGIAHINNIALNDQRKERVLGLNIVVIQSADLGQPVGQSYVALGIVTAVITTVAGSENSAESRFHGDISAASVTLRENCSNPDFATFTIACGAVTS